MAKPDTEQRKASVPYISYPTFKSFMTRIAPAIPARIDRSVLSNMSGAGQTHLLSTLRALDLIDFDGSPLPEMESLAQAFTRDDKQILRATLENNYPWLFEGFNLGNATSRLLVERFEAQGLSGDTIRKAIGFFLAAAKDAGIQISPHIKPSKAHRATKPGTPRRARPVSRAGTPAGPASRNGTDWATALLEKFPAFDPTWGADVQAKWITTFQKLMAMKPEAPQEQAGGEEEAEDEESEA